MNADLLVIGGGIVGLACAMEGAGLNKSTLLIERHSSFGRETSSRNSEVVHSGVYYPPGSLKARLCVAGNLTTYSDCRGLSVWHKKCGKLIVAVSEGEESELERLLNQGVANGVRGLEIIDRKTAARMEPHIICRSALSVPSTGVIDSHGLMKAYYHAAHERGADIIFRHEVLAAEFRSDHYSIRVRDDRGREETISVRSVINSAGLHADRIAQIFGIDIDRAGYRLHLNRGHYYSLSASKGSLITRLIYPVPMKNLVGAGIHVTIDMAGRCKLGPDAEFLNSDFPESSWYAFDDSRRDSFYAAARRYFPELLPGDLSPDQVGVRPKRAGSAEFFKDFVISEESGKGLPRLVNLIGIESPGLTCAREIAREALRILDHT